MTVHLGFFLALTRVVAIIDISVFHLALFLRFDTLRLVLRVTSVVTKQKCFLRLWTREKRKFVEEDKIATCVLLQYCKAP